MAQYSIKIDADKQGSAISIQVTKVQGDDASQALQQVLTEYGVDAATIRRVEISRQGA